mmetsp:Transcript_10960/g.20137  ORF Transcript_10960/g.20137 Transcript_10960/m.20137 type:complete len:422 (+) Transcript_10960:61-1326(+)
MVFFLLGPLVVREALDPLQKKQVLTGPLPSKEVKKPEGNTAAIAGRTAEEKRKREAATKKKADRTKPRSAPSKAVGADGDADDVSDLQKYLNNMQAADDADDAKHVPVVAAAAVGAGAAAAVAAADAEESEPAAKVPKESSGFSIVVHGEDGKQKEHITQPAEQPVVTPAPTTPLKLSNSHLDKVDDSTAAEVGAGALAAAAVVGASPNPDENEENEPAAEEVDATHDNVAAVPPPPPQDMAAPSEDGETGSGEQDGETDSGEHPAQVDRPARDGCFSWLCQPNRTAAAEKEEDEKQEEEEPETPVKEAHSMPPEEHFTIRKGERPSDYPPSPNYPAVGGARFEVTDKKEADLYRAIEESKLDESVKGRLRSIHELTAKRRKNLEFEERIRLENEAFIADLMEVRRRSRLRLSLTTEQPAQ